MFKQPLFLICTVLLLAGCGGPRATIQSFTPKEDDDLARRFIESVRTGDEAAAEAMLDPAVRQGEKTASGMHKLHDLLAHGEPISVEVIGCRFFSFGTVRGRTRKTTLSYQIHFPNSWAVGDIELSHSEAAPTVLGARFQPVPDSLETLNRFTLAGKSFFHYVVLAACVAIPLFILYTLIVCIRSRIRRKWLWIIFILFGVIQLRLDWTSGQVDFQPLAILLFGVGAAQASPYASWVLSCAVPLGAIFFLARRRELLRRMSPDPARPLTDADNAPPPLPQA